MNLNLEQAKEMHAAAYPPVEEYNDQEWFECAKCKHKFISARIMWVPAQIDQPSTRDGGVTMKLLPGMGAGW